MFFLDYVFIGLCILLLASIRFIKPVSGFNDDYLSKENCNVLRGFLVFVPPITHLCNMGVGFNATVTNYTTVIVSVFFFFTGYGLTKQHLLKDNYSQKYFLKRLPKVVIPYILATFIYVAVDFVFLGFLYPVSGIFNAIACGNPVVTASWYVLHVIAFYIWFWFMMKIARKNRLLLVILAVLYYVLTTLFCMKMGWGGHWWSTSFGLFVGVIWASFEKEINVFCKNHYWIAFAAALILLLLNLFWHVNYSLIYGSMLITLVVLMMKFNLKNPVLDFLGKISFEMYMVHGCFLIMGRCDRLYLENDAAFVTFVLGGTIIAGFAMWWIDGILVKWFDKGCKAVKLL